MSYQQIADVVDQLCSSLIQILQAAIATMQASSDSRTCRILMSIHTEHERLHTGLRAYRCEGDPGVLRSWLQFVTSEDLDRMVHDTTFTTNMPADEIAARKLKFDQELIDFYGHLANYSNNDRVINFFDELRLEAETRAANQSWFIREFQPDGDPPVTNVPSNSPQSSD